jgi:hypothetical protein
MPIIIPTVDEVARMDYRQRSAVCKRVRADLVAISESLALLSHGSSTPSEITKAAKEIEKSMPKDPHAAAHVAALLAAIS